VPDLFLGLIGVPGVDDGDNAGEDPGGSTHEQSGDVAEAKGTGKSRLLYG
jgi:hypothetical protein